MGCSDASTAPSLQKVRQKLAEEEASKAALISEAPPEWESTHVDISPSELIARGIQLESEKYVATRPFEKPLTPHADAV